MAGIWSSVWSLGNPIAAVIMGGVLSALALGRYAMNVKNIDQTQYKKGGLFGKGGRLTGPSHSENNGMPVINPRTGEIQAYMEGDEAIVNKKSMSDNSKYTVTGTPSQIVSKINSIGGGVDWMGGASISKYEKGGYFGAVVSPPVFSDYRASNISMNYEKDNRIEKLTDIVEDVVIAVHKSDSKDVVLNPKKVTEAQDREVKQTLTGDLI